MWIHAYETCVEWCLTHHYDVTKDRWERKKQRNNIFSRAKEVRISLLDRDDFVITFLFSYRSLLRFLFYFNPKSVDFYVCCVNDLLIPYHIINIQRIKHDSSGRMDKKINLFWNEHGNSSKQRFMCIFINRFFFSE